MEKVYLKKAMKFYTKMIAKEKEDYSKYEDNFSLVLE